MWSGIGLLIAPRKYFRFDALYGKVPHGPRIWTSTG